ncbi:hypothetical protein [Acinetobacter dispersus]|uniref:hypothetical protein n=1 Tax=Acinetobacter dispersus TaxID=70348 RepID=UPI00132F1F0E|nr:hypothetical protein [Acinetobacter dispersus]QHH99220.1 hypothetical protein FPL17_17400 [Acinetobacter dispersus]
MSNIEKAKQLILDSFDRKAKEGEKYDRFVIRKNIKHGIPQSDYDAAVVSLTTIDGYLDQNGCLTKKGFKHLFPSNIPLVRQKFLDELKRQGMRVNENLNFPVIELVFISSLNTQEELDLDEVFKALQNEGILKQVGRTMKLAKQI